MAGENAIHMNYFQSAPEVKTDRHLRVYGIRNARRPGLYEYEFHISPEGNHEALKTLHGRLSFSLPIRAFLPKARDAIRNEYERYAYAHLEGNVKPLVMLGMIDFEVVAVEGKNIAYSLNYKPKGEISAPIQIESRTTGMGGYLEAFCLKNLRRTAGATHMTTTMGAIEYLYKIPGFDDKVKMLESFTTSESRLGQLKKCGIDPMDVVEIGKWTRQVSKLSAENHFAMRLLAKESMRRHRMRTLSRNRESMPLQN